MHISRLIFGCNDVFTRRVRNKEKYEGVITEKNISFGSDGKFTAMDIYYPKSDEKLPVLVNVHGGGVVRGDKALRSGISRFFASNGWFVANINYRRAPKWKFPSATEDTINALNFVNTLGDKYNIDLKRIVLVGDSAGGFYASHAMAAITDEALRKGLNLPEYKGEKIKALVAFCAPFNLLKCVDRKSPFNVAFDIANCMFDTSFKKGDTIGDFPAKKYINVLDFINKDFPKTFIVEAVNDAFCGGQMEDMLKKLAEFNIETDFYVADTEGDGHCTHLHPKKMGSPKCRERVVEFLERVKNS